MKIKHILTAQCLLLAASCLRLAAQAEINPDHFPDEPSPAVSVPQPAIQARVQALHAQMEAWEKQLQTKSEMVEEARQQAVSAGIQGDGAGSYIDTYRQQQKEMQMLQAGLVPKIEEARSIIADLTAPRPPAVASVSHRPAQPRRHRSASAKKTVKPAQPHVASLGE